jgi:hypothetical protein
MTLDRITKIAKKINLDLSAWTGEPGQDRGISQDMTAMTGQQRQDSSVRIAVGKIAVVGQRAVGKIAVVEQLAQDSFDMTART